MTKEQLLAELAAQFLTVGTPALISDADNVKSYLVYVTETGLSAKLKKPTAYRKVVSFYVYKEGNGLEAAYYNRDEVENTSNRDITGDNSYLSINKMYQSSLLKGRVQSGVSLAAKGILDESDQIANHAKRLVWAVKVFTTPAYVDWVVQMVSISAVAQSAGGAITDNQIAAIITNNIDKMALASGV